jgi:hypothetical protein
MRRSTVLGLPSQLVFPGHFQSLSSQSNIGLDLDAAIRVESSNGLHLGRLRPYLKILG